MRHMDLFRYANAAGLSLQEAARRVARAENDRAEARLRAKGWRP